MAIEKLTDGQLHKKLKKLFRELWLKMKAKYNDICEAIVMAAERIERSVRIQNLLWLLEERGRHDLIACAYNGSFAV